MGSMSMKFSVRVQVLCWMLVFSLSGGVGYAADGLAGENYKYAFSVPFKVEEVVTSFCSMPCATPEVRDIELFLEGGFNVMGGNRIVGKGVISIHGNPLCKVISQNGGGKGAYCRVVGVKGGNFFVSGFQTGVKSVSGKNFTPTVKLIFELQKQADLFVIFFVPKPHGGVIETPVGHYQGSFTKLMTDSGLLGKPIEIQAARGAVKKYFASFSLPAPGYKRDLSGEGSLSFYGSPFRVESAP